MAHGWPPHLASSKCHPPVCSPLQASPSQHSPSASASAIATTGLVIVVVASSDFDSRVFALGLMVSYVYLQLCRHHITVLAGHHPPDPTTAWLVVLGHLGAWSQGALQPFISHPSLTCCACRRLVRCRKHQRHCQSPQVWPLHVNHNGVQTDFFLDGPHLRCMCA